MGFFDDIGNWLGSVFNSPPQQQQQMIPMSSTARLSQSPYSTPQLRSPATLEQLQNTQVQNWMPVATTPSSTQYPTQQSSTNNPAGTDYSQEFNDIFNSLTPEEKKNYIMGIKPISQYEQALINQRQQEAAIEQLKYQQQLQQSQMEYAGTQSYQQNQLALEQQRLAQEQAQYQAQLEAEKQQRLAQLAAQPKSWLEYASLNNQVPVIQPWMMPLMPQEYGINSVGTQIPGYNAQNMGGMPQLITPSAQLMARMGPTAQQQYYGYQQAQQGATPEESQYRLWSMAPPSGQNTGLRQVR